MEKLQIEESYIVNKVIFSVENRECFKRSQQKFKMVLLKYIHALVFLI